MLKILCTIFAVMVMATTFSPAAPAQVNDRARIVREPVETVPFNGARSDAARFRARYYGGVYRGAAFAWRGDAYRSRVRPGWYYGNWRNSYSPYWGWAVAADLLATAPTYYDHGYYYYGVGFGDEFGYDASIYCMQRFKSYDPVTGTYVGRGGDRYACP